MKEIASLPHAYEAVYEDSKLVVRYSGGKHNLIRLMQLLSEKQYDMGRVYSEIPTLNDVFLEITGTALRDSE